MFFKRTLLPLLPIVAIILSCAPAVQKKEAVEQPPEKPLTVEEQREQATQAFTEVLDLVEKVEKRSDAVPEMEKRYLEIIRKYPDAPLAQEIHWRLVELYLRDFDPPRVDDALAVFDSFKKRYPDSPLKTAIEDTLTRFYAGKGMWERLIELHSYRIEKFIETGKIDSPFFLFMYAEALRNTGDTEEALKGYRWVIKTFPDSSMADMANRRIKLIEENKER